MKYIIVVLVVMLLVLRNDFWNWDDATLVFGLMPLGLFYQMCISIGASIVWLLAVNFAWPEELSQERDDEGCDDD